jgi:excisionase family DNA binding protein
MRVLTPDAAQSKLCRMPAALGAPLLDINEVAEYLGVSHWTVRRWIEQGRLPVVQIGGKSAPIRIRPESLQRVTSRWETRTR